MECPEPARAAVRAWIRASRTRADLPISVNDRVAVELVATIVASAITRNATGPQAERPGDRLTDRLDHDDEEGLRGA